MLLKSTRIRGSDFNHFAILFTKMSSSPGCHSSEKIDRISTASFFFAIASHSHKSKFILYKTSPSVRKYPLFRTVSHTSDLLTVLGMSRSIRISRLFICNFLRNSFYMPRGLCKYLIKDYDVFLIISSPIVLAFWFCKHLTFYIFMHVKRAEAYTPALLLILIIQIVKHQFLKYTPPGSLRI